MKVAEITFGEWLPDAPDYKNPGLVTAENVYPSAGGYAPFPNPAAQGKSVANAIKGAEAFFRADGTQVLAAGTNTSLMVRIGEGSIVETGSLSAIGSNSWDFAQFNKYLFAVAPSNNPKYLSDIATDTSWSDAPGSPPQAKHIARIGNHLVIGNLSAASLPFTLQTSAENDPTDWPTPGTTDARLKASGRVALQQEYGAITGFAGDRYPMVFQERGISRMDPVGPPTVFDIKTIEEARGCIAPRSLVTVGFLTYFLAHDGFYATDGNSVEPIASRRVNAWFAENVSEADRWRTHGAISWRDFSIVWSFYPVDDATGFKRQIIYSWQENRWSYADIDIDWMVTTNLTNPSSAAETWVPSVFKQNASSASELYYLIGPNREATIETADFAPETGRRVSVNAIYPLIEATAQGSLALEAGDNLLLEDGGEIILEVGEIRAALRTRDQLGSDATTTAEATVNDAGFCPVYGDGRYARARLVCTVGSQWDKAQGVQVEYRPSGRV